jgi:hypothetical protein
VRVAGLLSASDNRMLGNTIAFHQSHIDQFLHSLRRQRYPIEPQLIMIDRGLTQHIVGCRDRLFGRSLGDLDEVDFLGGLHHALFVERVPLRKQLISQGLELDGMAKGKVHGNLNPRDAGLPQQDMDDLDRAWLGDPLRLGPPFDLRIREHPIDGRLALCPIHFEITHHENPFSFNLQIDKGVRRDKLRRVI